jgi:hypothetical protein
MDIVTESVGVGGWDYVEVVVSLLGEKDGNG